MVMFPAQQLACQRKFERHRRDREARAYHEEAVEANRPCWANCNARRYRT